MPLLAVPVIAVALVAVLAVLLYFAAEAFGHALAKFIPSNIPVIGSRVHDAVDSFAEKAVAGVRLYFAVKLDLAAQLIKYPAVAIRVHLSTILGTLQSLGHMGAYIIRTVIPNLARSLIGRMDVLYNEAIGFVRGQVAALIARMDVLYNQAIGFVRGQVAALIARMDVLYNEAIGFVRSEVAGLVGRIDVLFNETIAFVRSEVFDLIRRMDVLYNEAIAFARGIEVTLSQAIDQAYLRAIGYVDIALPAAIKSALGTIGSIAASAWPAVWPDIQAGVKGVEDVIGDALPDIRAAVRELERAIPGDLADSLAISGVTAVTLLRYLERCGIPNCRNLGKFGHDIQALFGLVEDGALLAFIAETIRDPEGAADMARRDLVDPFLTIGKEFASLIGVNE